MLHQNDLEFVTFFTRPEDSPHAIAHEFAPLQIASLNGKPLIRLLSFPRMRASLLEDLVLPSSCNRLSARKFIEGSSRAFGAKDSWELRTSFSTFCSKRGVLQVLDGHWPQFCICGDDVPKRPCIGFNVADACLFETSPGSSFFSLVFAINLIALGFTRLLHLSHLICETFSSLLIHRFPLNREETTYRL